MPIHPSVQSLIADIDAFLAQSGMPQSDFGLLSIGDPNLCRQLKAGGREPRLSTIDRIRAFIREREGIAA